MALSYPQRINMQYAPSDVADSNSMNELARFGARPADHPAVASGRIGVLLVNLGTPDATDYWSMRRYLKEFLSDRRVIEENRLKWWLVLNLIILTVRPSR